MIIQCEKCLTRFRLDDSRVTEKGVKVRCTRCKHVFTVRKEEPEIDSLQATVSLPSAAPPSEEWSFADEAAPTPAADSAVYGDIPLKSKPFDFTSPDLPPFDTSEVSFDSKEYALSVTEDDQEVPAVTTAIGSEFNFSDDEMSGSVVQTTQETGPGDFSFDFEDNSRAEENAVKDQDSGSKRDTQPAFDAPADAPFNQGDIDFGDELIPAAAPQVSQEGLKPYQAVPPAAVTVKPEDDMLTPSFPGEVAAHEQQELPPLSIPSRRKQSPLFGILISLVALLVISVLGYFGYTSLSAPKETTSQEIGKITVRGVTSAFVKNSAAGELLVVSGEAFNEYSKPRASIQVMVTVLDAAGQSVATKNAYGGNPLTKEQLETLPLEKIEAAMANPFGDSLANMGVAPGKSIPFVVVLANIPSGAKDFSVQSAGSTVATGK